MPFGRNKCAGFSRASRVQLEKKQRRMSKHIPVTTASWNRIGQDEQACHDVPDITSGTCRNVKMDVYDRYIYLSYDDL